MKNQFFGYFSHRFLRASVVFFPIHCARPKRGQSNDGQPSRSGGLYGRTEVERSLAWYESAVGLAKVTSGLADLAANNPQWSALLGAGSNLESLRLSAGKISVSLKDNNNDIYAVKAGDVLGIVGGVSDLAGNVLLKPGPTFGPAVALKGIGLGAGVAQNVVGEDTIGQVLGRSTANNNAPVVSPSLFPQTPSLTTLAPDGFTPLNTGITSQTSNTQTDVYWTKDSSGNYTKNESITTKDSNGNVLNTNATQYKYNSDGSAVSANTYLYDKTGALQNSQALVPTSNGQSWANAPAGTTAPVVKTPQSYFTDNGANSHSVTLKDGARLDYIVMAQKNAGNNISLADLQASNPNISNINNVSAGQLIYIPQKLVDGSTTYHYAGGTSINSNAATGEYHMVVPNTDGNGGQTVYSRSYDGNALGGEGYTLRQSSTNTAGVTTFDYAGRQATLNGDVQTATYHEYSPTGALLETRSSYTGTDAYDQSYTLSSSTGPDSASHLSISHEDGSTTALDANHLSASESNSYGIYSEQEISERLEQLGSAAARVEANDSSWRQAA